MERAPPLLLRGSQWRQILRVVSAASLERELLERRALQGDLGLERLPGIMLDISKIRNIIENRFKRQIKLRRGRMARRRKGRGRSDDAKEDWLWNGEKFSGFMRENERIRSDGEIGTACYQGYDDSSCIIPPILSIIVDRFATFPLGPLQQKQPHNNIMMDSDEQQHGNRLILPPVANSKTPLKLPSILQMLGAINKKREEYQTELQQVEPTDQSYTLKYARCETDSTHLQKKGLTEQESLARGSILESSFYRRPKRKNRLLAANITSTIEPVKTQQVTSSAPKRAHTRQMTDERYKSVESKAEEGGLRRQPTQKEIVGEQPQNDINNYFGRSPQFVIPISVPKRDRSVQAKLRQRAQTQKESNATKENSQSSDQKLNLERFKELITDLKKGSKTNQRLQKTIKSLQLFNPFFRKVQRVIGVCLLRMGHIKQKLANSILYQMDEPQMSFYIILQGEVKITGRSGMHKVCETGETLLEEILQPAEGKQKFVMAVALQKAKVMVDSWILQIEREQFKKLQKELNKFGFRQGLNEMKTLIKRNSIVKTWLRNKFRLLQKK